MPLFPGLCPHKPAWSLVGLLYRYQNSECICKSRHALQTRLSSELKSLLVKRGKPPVNCANTSIKAAEPPAKNKITPIKFEKALVKVKKPLARLGKLLVNCKIVLVNFEKSSVNLQKVLVTFQLLMNMNNQ